MADNPLWPKKGPDPGKVEDNFGLYHPTCPKCGRRFTTTHPGDRPCLRCAVVVV